MKYLVMEVRPAYAVVLDEEGRFLKAANLHYQVGDTVAFACEYASVLRCSTSSYVKKVVIED